MSAMKRALEQHTAAAQAVILAAACKTCRHEIRLDTEHYDTARWVHEHMAELVSCPTYHTCGPAQS